MWRVGDAGEQGGRRAGGKSMADEQAVKGDEQAVISRCRMGRQSTAASGQAGAIEQSTADR